MTDDAMELYRFPIEDEVCELSHFSIFRVSGVDRKTFLQGQLTCDLNTLSANQWLLGARCDAKGKMQGILRIFEYQEVLYLLGSKAELEASITELKKYSIFSKVEWQDISSDYHILGVFGQSVQQRLQPQFSIEPQGNLFASADHMLLRWQENRFVLLQPSRLPIGEVPNEQALIHWKIHDIQQGIPHLTSASLNEYVPQMLNLQALGGISFKKGCYSGQEMVARMHYLGKNKKAMYILHGQSGDAEPGVVIEQAIGENWRRAGHIINVAAEEKQLFILAVLPIDLEPTTQLRLKGDEDEHILSIVPLPYPLKEETKETE